ncbi:hypothetical protein Pcinc_037670 [Petrolisthes cinctipes]|uniref:Uncharacterized protein n=1 Tax=Petrolisthes cinctipes TaxID=88211 RepID=A0AAE1ENR0_PETCI|nr:hypothetical protein Pcinc_037670 [Petrolisthes cinctipes]
MRDKEDEAKEAEEESGSNEEEDEDRKGKRDEGGRVVAAWEAVPNPSIHELVPTAVATFPHHHTKVIEAQRAWLAYGPRGGLKVFGTVYMSPPRQPRATITFPLLSSHSTTHRIPPTAYLSDAF